MPMRILLSALLCILACVLLTASARADDARTITLSSGIRAILVPNADSKLVAVETIYRFGFMNEPVNLPQAAHLLEHIACKGATRSYKPGESYQQLSGKGVVNAETLADLTHYDYVVPPDQLGLVLQIEAERLSSLRIDQQIIGQEAPRCYAEVAAVESQPQAPVFKFAVMAANQAWRVARPSVAIKAGLEEAKVQDLVDLHSRWYTPSNLTVVIVGGFTADSAEALLKQHLGALPAAPAPPRSPIDWAKAPSLAMLEWDCTVPVVFVAFAPPKEPAQAAAISMWCETLLPKVMADPALTAVSRSIFGTNSIWPAGELPVFFCAALKPDADPVKTRDLLVSRVLSLAAQPLSPGDQSMLNGGAAGFAAPPGDSLAMLKRQLKSGPLAARADAEQLLLGNTALQIGVRALMTGPDAQAWANAVNKELGAGLPALVDRIIVHGQPITTVLVPRR